MFKAKKIAKSILNLFGLTPYVYYTYKYNDPFKIKKKLFGDQNIIIFDVGAYDGRSAKKYAEKFPKSTIYSFEPTPNSFEKLSQSLSSNNQIHLHNIALSSFCGETDFYINDSSLTNSLLNVSSGAEAKSIALKSQSTIKVKTDTIDNFVINKNLDKINILKIDVQGAELEVLKGASKTLKNNTIDLIFIEVEFVQLYQDQPVFHHISLFLEEHGYKIYSLYNLSISKKGQIIYGDAIFLKLDLFEKI